MSASLKPLQKLEFGDKDVVLVKVPPELGRIWTEACHRSLSCAGEDAHRELGSITLRRAPPQLPVDDEKVAQLKPIGNLSVDGVEGRIHRNVRVKVDEQQQMELLKSRNAAAAPAPVRRIAMIDPGHKEKSAVAAHRSAKLANAAQAKLMPVSVGVRRPKLDKEGLEKFLFMCFEREKHWHFKDLVKETKQSAPKLKEVLNDIAEKVKQGRFKDMYQLRRDLQDTNE